MKKLKCSMMIPDPLDMTSKRNCSHPPAKGDDICTKHRNIAKRKKQDGEVALYEDGWRMFAKFKYEADAGRWIESERHFEGDGFSEFKKWTSQSGWIIVSRREAKKP